MIITTSHAAFRNGNIYEAPANTVVEMLQSKKEDFVFIRHSMDGSIHSIAYFYKKGELFNQKTIFTIPSFSFLRYITEIIFTFFFLVKYKSKNKNIPLYYIGVDPLNALSGVLLKKFGTVKRSVFYTADYTEKRFANKILNLCYLKIDKYCVKHSDQVWNVSTRIYDLRKDFGLAKSKNIYLPNVPSDQYKKFTKNSKNSLHLITLGLVDEQLDFIGIFNAIKELSKEYPKILLKIVGTGPKEAEYKKYVKKNKIDKNVSFLGYLKHEEALEEISKSGIGLALYNGNWSFNYYGDSMKCREYFCFGLPVVTTDTHSTVDDITNFKCGVVSKMDQKDYINAIKKILEQYKTYSENSLKLRDKYSGIHEKIILHFAKS